jgi:hypothetical protein
MLNLQHCAENIIVGDVDVYFAMPVLRTE